MDTDGATKRVVVVGGGLVGAMNACYFAKRGFHVDLFEARDDIRAQKAVLGRSINLALSFRGRRALAGIGLEDVIVQSGIPMYARMIHDLDGTRHPIPYGTKDQCIMSIDRRRLNELMLTEAEKYSNVKIHFGHKFSSCKFSHGECTFKSPSDDPVDTKHDLVVGCDGAYSRVRAELMKEERIDFSQMYIEHGYMELRIPPTKDNKFAMETNYLHIWPRNTFMMIGLPNATDNSFVMTLFMPFAIFNSLKTEDQLLEFFEKTFPDSIPLIGRESLVKSFFSRTALPLVTVKCKPYHTKDKAVIMGDAAHAMVPFYGQGMNCGFEDCFILNQLLEKHNNNFGDVLEEYSQTRNPDAESICDLALYNYIEMRASVNSRLFLMRKRIDNLLHWLMPARWVPLYTSVSFTGIPYSRCIKNKKWQDQLLHKTLTITGVALLAAGAYTVVTLAATKPSGVLKELLEGAWVEKLGIRW